MHHAPEFSRLGLWAALLALLPAAAPAVAQTPAAVVEIRGGLEVAPPYFGSEDMELGPDAALRFNYVRLPGGLEFGAVDRLGRPAGFGLQGSFRYIGERDTSGDAALGGLDPVDASLELGVGLGYQADDWRAFGAVRYGVLGHNAWVGEAGADALFHPSDELIINLGPRANFGSERFMQTYFGVSQEEAAGSPIDDFSPSAGLYSVGLELGARYAFSPRWGLEGAATYDRLVEDAADSPVAQVGSRDQFGVRFGVTRTIRLGF
jgi:MipA family protein